MENKYAENKNRAKIKKAEWYYDVDGVIFKDMNYIECLELKIELSKILIDKIQDVPYMYRDFYRLGKSLDSQKFNRELINEAMGIV